MPPPLADKHGAPPFGLEKAREGVRRQVDRLLVELDNRGKLINSLINQRDVLTTTLKKKDAIINTLDAALQGTALGRLAAECGGLPTPASAPTSVSAAAEAHLKMTRLEKDNSELRRQLGQLQSRLDAIAVRDSKTVGHIAKEWVLEPAFFVCLWAIRIAVCTVATVAAHVPMRRAIQEPSTHYEITAGQCLQVPEHPNRWRVGKLLGEGTFGKVALAEDCSSGGTVAVKVIRHDADLVEDAELEVFLLRLCKRQDPDDLTAIVKIIDDFYAVAGDQRHPCMTFPVHGQSLQWFTLDKRALRPKEAARVAWDCAGALDFLHRYVRLVHTDMKPENILFNTPVDGSGADGDIRMPDYPAAFVRLVDLGSSAVPLTDRTALVTTLQYRAPEVWRRHRWDEQCDVWSLGVSVAEMASGRQLFDTTSADVLELLVQLFVSAPASPTCPRAARLRSVWHRVPAAVRAIANTCLRLEPEDRLTPLQLLTHESVAAVWPGAKAAAERRLAGLGAPPPPPEFPKRERRPPDSAEQPPSPSPAASPEVPSSASPASPGTPGTAPSPASAADAAQPDSPSPEAASSLT